MLNSLLSPLNTVIHSRLAIVVLHFSAATGARRPAVPHHWPNGVLASLLFSLEKKRKKHVIISSSEVRALGWMRRHYIQNMWRPLVRRVECDLAFVIEQQLHLWNEFGEGDHSEPLQFQHGVSCRSMRTLGHTQLCAQQKPSQILDVQGCRIHPTVLALHHQIVTCSVLWKQNKTKKQR